ncbi:hypothetical protein Ctob_011225 [Chrysochromulina tobinii]|uniref:Uncharacterized protein n=1 Tax=Chrysochromulina tobinii TaxID=1460289 RepID=A0A0M0JY89_9EUKA|nr:hypothetical protein Ctob_011225 [Chrysochromulina tobinii]|eukprot:KOO31621.1 hypothetical protein Ctob_011225 [Chrysochromulina sp. CCMP291]
MPPAAARGHVSMESAGRDIPKFSGDAYQFRQVEDSTGMAEMSAGKMMTRQQASLHAPDSMGFDFAYGDAAYEAAMDASGQGMMGYTGYEGKNYETDVTDIDDRLDDIKFLHGPFVERSPAGGWPMKYALLGEFNPTMSSVIGTKTGYGAHYSKEAAPDEVSEVYNKAWVPDTAAQQWAMPKVPESRSIGSFYQGKQTVTEPARRVPPPTRYQSYTPKPPAPDPPIDCSMRPNRQNESVKHPDPAWGYTGHEAAHRIDNGDEELSMASRIAKRRQQSIERRFNDTPDRKKLVMAQEALNKLAESKPKQDFGWTAFPPKGLYVAQNTDLQPSQISGPNNGQISSAKLYASSGN